MVEICSMCGDEMDGEYCPTCEAQMEQWWAQQNQDEQWIEEQTDGHE